MSTTKRYEKRDTKSRKSNRKVDAKCPQCKIGYKCGKNQHICAVCSMKLNCKKTSKRDIIVNQLIKLFSSISVSFSMRCKYVGNINFYIRYLYWLDTVQSKPSLKHWRHCWVLIQELKNSKLWSNAGPYEEWKISNVQNEMLALYKQLVNQNR